MVGRSVNICQELFCIARNLKFIKLSTRVRYRSLYRATAHACLTGSHLPYTGGPTKCCVAGTLGPEYWDWGSQSLPGDHSPQETVVPPSQDPSHFFLASWRRGKSCGINSVTYDKNRQGWTGHLPLTWFLGMFNTCNIWSSIQQASCNTD
jgi:hypothetical protein